MPIDTKQRKKNTWNKLDHLVNRVNDDTSNYKDLTPNSQGRKGKELVTAHRIHNQVAGGDDIMRDWHREDPREGRKIERDAEKTMTKHYGEGANMQHHGEGKPYGDK